MPPPQFTRPIIDQIFKYSLSDREDDGDTTTITKATLRKPVDKLEALTEVDDIVWEYMSSTVCFSHGDKAYTVGLRASVGSVKIEDVKESSEEESSEEETSEEESESSDEDSDESERDSPLAKRTKTSREANGR